MAIFTKTLYLFLLALLIGTDLFAQQNFFSVAHEASATQLEGVAKKVNKMAVFNLSENGMRTYLTHAPLEFHNNGKTIPLQIPLPDGGMETFNLTESPILSPAVAQLHPEIKTYTGNGTTDKNRIVRLSLTSSGFNAIILNVNGDAVYFEPYPGSKSNTYFSYYAKDAIAPSGNGLELKHSQIGTDYVELPNSIVPLLKKTNGVIAANTNSTGGILTTYKLALAASGEFVVQHGSITNAFNTIVAYVNRINAYFRNELSINFVLVSGTNLMFPDPTTDPYTDEYSMLSQNQTACDSVLGPDNYDVGHVLSYSPSASAGGLSIVGGVCRAAYKGWSVSYEADPRFFSQNFTDKAVFHEMGHSVGMLHSFNSAICGSTSPTSTIEPGSGITVMSYAFLCGSDNYSQFPRSYPIPTAGLMQYHTLSYQQAVSYLSTVSCGNATATGNTPPVVVMPPNYTIPKSTPFSLTGSATDVNNDALTYCWEGMDNGDNNNPQDATTLANTAQPPFFRSYAPSNSPTRIYPLLDSILSGANYAIGDKLPSISFVTNHNLTVRDNNASGGGVSFGSMQVTVDGNIGPFLETTNLSGSYPASSTKTITWSVNGTNVSTPFVKISLSVDGGYTWPNVLLASTPNTGSAIITLPNIATTTARIKVEAVGNIFFDISNKNFTITATVLPVTLTSFTAALQNKKDALLKWETATETNSKGYEIEMAEGSSLAFADISFVAAKGTTTTVSDYSFIAPNLTPGVYYFRLKMIDMDGSFTYSSVQSITVVGDKGLISVYPTPVHDQLTVVLSTETQNANLQLVNSLGQVLLVNTTPNGNIRLLNMGNLPAGLYLLKVMNGTNLVTTQKVVKQ